jgi:NADP-reducing hydrogenase subunit HndD
MKKHEDRIYIDKELCTGCRRCSQVCPVDAIEGRQGDPQTINTNLCVLCGQCIQICSAYASAFNENITPREQMLEERKMLPSVKEPLFAAYNEGKAPKVKAALADKELYKMVQCAPAVRVAIAEEFGMPLGSLSPGKLAAALRRVGFDAVYDTNFGADLTIMEEGNELINRVTGGGTLPMFTSCCPAWVKFVEQAYPELIPHLSSCKSPMQMSGALFKTYGSKVSGVDAKNIYSAAVMPCTCKSFESARPEMNSSGHRDVDAVITTRELAHMIKDAGIDFIDLPDEKFDNPLGMYSGAGNIFCSTGGVTEAALRTAYEIITKEPIPDLDLEYVRGDNGIRTATVKAGDVELKLAIVSGLKNAIPVLESIKAGKADFQFIEVMTCPGGCVNGGGQPKVLLPIDKKVAAACRTSSTYSHDANLKCRKSHENPQIKKIYKEFLGEPLGDKSHHLLHTKYTARR